MFLRKLKNFLSFDTAGWVATSSLMLCAVSGVLLAIPYDFNTAYRAVFELVLLQPAASVVRNLHYWSAQLFVVAAMVHTADHLLKSTETTIRSRKTWLMLSLAIVFIGYEMISGFILKGDAAGLQARRILASLLESTPLLGKMLGSAFTGSEEHWMVVYVQHISTGTMVLFFAIFAHVKKIWPEPKTILVLFGVLLATSLVFRAPLGPTESNLLKGPWFFVAIQELLHLTSHPGYLVLLLFLLFVLFYLLPGMKPGYRFAVKRAFLAMSLLYLVTTVMVLIFRGENWQLRSWREFLASEERLIVFDPIDLLKNASVALPPENQKLEGCLWCHGRMTGLSASHAPSVVGCWSCHKGDPFTLDKSLAHSKMVKVPGNFSNVRQTCGTQNCHAEISERVTKSLMATASGIVAVDKFVFGETSSLNDTFQIKNTGNSAADRHLRNLCAGCHLGNEKIKPGDPAWLDRGGGCNACHLHYDDAARESMQRMKLGSLPSGAEVHPAIDLQVSDDRCKSCHSRSGRISLSYEGWNETAFGGADAKPTTRHLVLPDERMVEFVQDDIHHQRGMGCIDCHGSSELMGDGKSHKHKEDAVKVQCIDCHPTGKANAQMLSHLPDSESQMIAWLRKYDPSTQIVVTAEGNLPLLNTRVDSLGQIFLTGKLDGKVHLSKPTPVDCEVGKAHLRLSCESCHTAWVPRCLGCHNSFEKGTSGFDLLTGRSVVGTWVEYAGKSEAMAPTLGILEGGAGRVVTTMPGMILTIDKGSFEGGRGTSFRRLYAPASGHTTQKSGRSCKSCHNNPLAIGYGKGEMRYQISGTSGKWSFEPSFGSSKQDSLPEDAWIGFLKDARQPDATRSSLRPFTVVEQKRILQVGSCLTCHDGGSKVMQNTLVDFRGTVTRCQVHCILPSF